MQSAADREGELLLIEVLGGLFSLLRSEGLVAVEVGTEARGSYGEEAEADGTSNHRIRELVESTSSADHALR